jgi:hypothetical protein
MEATVRDSGFRFSDTLCFGGLSVRRSDTYCSRGIDRFLCCFGSKSVNCSFSSTDKLRIGLRDARCKVDFV